MNLEDETGLINVVCSKGCWARHRHVARTAPAMLVRGRLERAEGVTNVIAEKLEFLPLGAGRLGGPASSGKRSKRTTTAFDVGVLLSSATESSGTSTFASGK